MPRNTISEPALNDNTLSRVLSLEEQNQLDTLLKKIAPSVDDFYQLAGTHKNKEGKDVQNLSITLDTTAIEKDNLYKGKTDRPKGTMLQCIYTARPYTFDKKVAAINLQNSALRSILKGTGMTDAEIDAALVEADKGE